MISVVGSFWRPHIGAPCPMARQQKSNRHYLLPKLARNFAHDIEPQVVLAVLGGKFS